jgi:N-acetylmuramoyl-L-alanine amidase
MGFPMSPLFKLALCASFSAFLISCGAPTAGRLAHPSAGRSEYGHRPGPKGFKTVIIDAGHGGKDSGAVSRHTGQMEKDLAFDTAKRIARNLSRDFKIVMVRSNDTFVELDDRVDFANRYGDAILVSVHYNSGPAAIRGPETYYWRVDSHGLAVRCQRAMKSVSPAESGSRGLVRRRMRLTRNPEIPCVLLEGGYLSHAAESRLVATPDYRQKLADALATAIRAQAAHGDAGTGPLPAPIQAPMSRPTDAPE